MALDESKENDEKFDIDGYTYVVEKDFLAQAKPIKVDFLEVGFKVTSSIKLESSCGSCSTTGSCCS